MFTIELGDNLAFVLVMAIIAWMVTTAMRK